MDVTYKTNMKSYPFQKHWGVGGQTGIKVGETLSTKISYTLYARKVNMVSMSS